MLHTIIFNDNFFLHIYPFITQIFTINIYHVLILNPITDSNFKILHAIISNDNFSLIFLILSQIKLNSIKRYPKTTLPQRQLSTKP